MLEGETINRKTFQAYFLWTWHDYIKWLEGKAMHPMDKLLERHRHFEHPRYIQPTIEGFMEFLAEQEYE